MKINLTTPPILAFFPPIVLLAPKVVVTYILLAGLIFLLFISARRNLRQFTYKKIFFVGLLLPSLVMTLASEEKSEILRYVPLLLMILLYPFKGIQKKHVKTTIGITLAFMILIQIAIGLDYSLAINLRETFYPVEKIIWKSGVFSSGLSIRENRMGGIYYNPNVMGSLTVLSGIIFYVVDKPYKIISIKNISWLIVGLSVILSGSRTAMAVFFMFSYFLVEQHIVQLEKSIYILRTLVFLLLLIFITPNMWLVYEYQLLICL